jgi:site-specific DNA recombinase
VHASALSRAFPFSGEKLSQAKRRFTEVVDVKVGRTAGWRLPTAKIERSIAAAAQRILDDQQTMVSAIEEAGLDSSRVAPLLKSAAAWSERLQLEQDNALSSLIDRVDLGQDGMRLSIKLPLSNAESGAPDGSSHLSLKRHVPMQIRRRGVELRLGISSGARASCKTDQPLLRAVARAHCWFDDLVTGRCGSMVEIAKCNGVGKQYASRLIRLAFLAPEMVELIVQGVNPLSLPRKHYGLAFLIFQGVGRRKSEPSDLCSRPEHVPINSGPATILVQSKMPDPSTS